MLLKCSQAQKRMKSTGTGKPQRATGLMKMTTGMMNVTPRIHRKVIKAATKRPAQHRPLTVSKKEERLSVDPCDNSNDSGLGFDHHLDYQVTPQASLRFSDKEWFQHLNYSAKPLPKHKMPYISSVFRPSIGNIDPTMHLACWPEESPEIKRRRLEIKLESDDANDNFSFPETITPTRPPLCVPVTRTNRGKLAPAGQVPFNIPTAPLTLSSQLSSTSRNGRIHLQILCQPEQQHRARYQTEGSRGAVKDRTGNGFPVVKLVGYDQPTFLQVFIGTDQGRIVPHMFYQACRVSGKNSTPCVEKKVDGTIVIEVDVEPSKDMVVTCDCVGILKERNVDVEHRFPEEGSGRSKKKSTRCRMVFRTSITHPDGTIETLQVTSQPIVCTQPPGVPEICKKSLTSSPATGGQELFILGKNFLKDTRVIFQEGEGSSTTWKQCVQPDKEFLQQSHLVCTVPYYQKTDITEPVSVRLCVESSGKCSEPHTFTYTPIVSGSALDKTNSSALTSDGTLYNPGANITPTNSNVGVGTFIADNNMVVEASPPMLLNPDPGSSFISSEPHPAGQEEKVHPVMLWPAPMNSLEKPLDIVSQIMPPPPLLPLNMRRPSLQMIVPEISQEELKKEMPDSPEVPQNFSNVSDLTSTQSPSMDTLRRFVSDKNNAPLPSLIVDNFLSNLEGVNYPAKEELKTQLIPDVPQLLDQSVVKTFVEEPPSKMMTDTQSNISNLTSSVIINNSSPLVFTSSGNGVSTSNNAQENLNIISNTTLVSVPSATPNLPVHSLGLQHSSLISQEQKARLDALVSSALVTPSVTERLDAFVNSAADSHISPGNSPTMLSPASSIPSDTSHIGPIQNDPSISLIPVEQVSRPLTQMLQESPIPSQPDPQVLTQSSLCSLLSATSSIPSMVSMEHISPQPINLTQPVLSINNSSQYEENKFSSQNITSDLNQNQSKEQNQFLLPHPSSEQDIERKESGQYLIPLQTPAQESVIVTALQKQEVFDMKPTEVPPPQSQVKKCEEGIPLADEFTDMSEHDLIHFINTSYFEKDFSG